MARKILAFDFGGVIADYSSLLQATIKELFTVEIPLGPDLLTLAILEKFGRKKSSRIYHHFSGKVMEYPLIEGAREALAELKERGYRNVIISAQTIVGPEVLVEYCRIHRLLIDGVHVVKRSEDKKGVCEQVRPDVFVDDNEFVLDYLEGVVQSRIFYDLFRTGAPTDYLRVQSWEELLVIIKNLET